ncbi:ring-cleaving dioxygenase [Bacillus testis]|uniref:ring-cleaving dioxygenase n=1 Tax=Bacillus testis TaxID=1622072 RepID=UPI00067F42AA|nr:ring-cleaving dioxygenase [Bacillus testis]
MTKQTKGIHHITAIVGHPQENADFYAGFLGLRLVKKTINFDDPGTYHLYFGDEIGNPGTIITFFPWPGAHQGKNGSGQVGITSYAVPPGSFPFWEKRLHAYNIEYLKITRFGEDSLLFDDLHGLHIELVEREEGPANAWANDGFSSKVAIKGFAGATLLTAQPEQTGLLLEKVMGLTKVGKDKDFVRYQSIGDLGNRIDVKQTVMPKGQMGVGTVHHIAWRAENDADQLDWKDYLETEGMQVTPVKERQYFNAVYFREPGSILFEIATDPPGFTIDETREELGTKLMLPKWYEPQRGSIEEMLAPFEVRKLD